jgi:formylglycine-generating enzyme required for sulfatase activity
MGKFARAAAALVSLTAGCARSPGVKVDWVTLPAGSFMMGAADGSADARPRHEVKLKSFQLAKSLTTKAQYAACVDAGVCAAPACRWPAGPGEDAHPVSCVSWDEARVYAKWAGGRLPSEAEWEYAARGAGRDERFPWGDAPPTCARARTGGCGDGPAPVCSSPSGRTRQGLCDMAGEVWEWTADGYHGSYEGAPADGSAWADAGLETPVNRGGSWDFDERVVHAYDRNRAAAGAHSDDLGFRPAR